jgi:hypothetical protein
MAVLKCGTIKWAVYTYDRDEKCIQNFYPKVAGEETTLTT